MQGTLEGADGTGDRVVPAVIGDARTVEPCALLDPAAIAPGRSARVVPDLGSPAACTVGATVAGGDVVVVATLEPVATAVVAGREERVDGLVVRRTAPRDGICTRTVVTTEGVHIAIDAAAAEAKEAGVEVQTHPVEADPADAILNVAEEVKADLIVVGNKGMTGARRYLLGSVPNNVSHQAPCSVIIVRTT